MIETLLKQELERQISKIEDDTTKHKGQTIINIDHGLSSYAWLYLLLGQQATPVSDVSEDVGKHWNFTTETKLQKMSEDITQMQETNKKFYLELLEELR